MSEACGKREDVVASASVASVSYWVFNKIAGFRRIESFFKKPADSKAVWPKGVGG